jgi:hypothetical protein
MSAPGTVDRLILAAVERGDVTVAVQSWHGYQVCGVDADYDFSGKVFYLGKDGFVDIPALDGALVELTDDGRKELNL